jgi:nucleoside-diphosphate-sugar epimerase
MRVVITGAAGNIGRLVTEELANRHELVLVDRRPTKGRKSIVANLSRSPERARWRPRWDRAFEGADVAIHLAAVLYPRGWRGVLRNNIQATWHVLDAAARHRVSRVVFASSGFAVRAEEADLAPACYEAGGPKVASDVPPRPLHPYGLSKAFGENAGRMLVDEGRLRSFVAVRIGFCPPSGVAPTDEVLRRRWIGHRDTASLMRRCTEADLEGFHVVYGVSAQPDSPYDLSHTRRLLDWQPVETSLPVLPT